MRNEEDTTDNILRKILLGWTIRLLPSFPLKLNAHANYDKLAHPLVVAVAVVSAIHISKHFHSFIQWSHLSAFQLLAFIFLIQTYHHSNVTYVKSAQINLCLNQVWFFKSIFHLFHVFLFFIELNKN